MHEDGDGVAPTLIAGGRERLAQRSSAIVSGLIPFFESLVEPVMCTDNEWRILYRNPVFAASWRIPKGSAPPVVSVVDGVVTLELADHSGVSSQASFEVTPIRDGRGAPQIYVGRARSGDDGVVGELRQAAALIAARIAALDDLGPVRAWDDELDECVQSLSTREREIFDLVLDGNRISTVASLLYLSENTVRNYLKRIYQKLDVHSLGELRERMAPNAVYHAS